MASTSSVSSSGGLDVQGLVSQLMTLERQPIDKLNTQVSSYQTKISSFGTISGLASSLQTSLQSLDTNFQGYTATPSDTSVFSASAASTAAAGSYTLDVANLARSQSLVAVGQASSTTAIGDGTSTTISFDFGTISGGTLTSGVYSGAAFASNGDGTKSITIDGTNNTLQGIRDAINNAKIGVSATIVNDGSGTPYRLALTSEKSGVSNSLKISTSGGDGTLDALLANDPAGVQHLNQTTAAQNANLTVNGIAITSPANTVTDAIQGVTLTLNKPTTTQTNLTVAHDTAAVKTAVSGFVDAYNALVSQLKSRSAFGSSTDTTKPALAGDGTVRLMLSQLHGIFNVGASGGTLTSLSQVGITSKADGTLKLDSSKLNTAMTNNFSDVTNLFTSATGFSTRLKAWTDSTLAPGGLIDSRTQSLNTSITGYNNQISKLEVRMAILQKQYTKTYSDLNVMLTNMSGTSAYLTQQLANL
ncbi:flagellar hook-associated protein 2 [Methyloglobulus morosus KoM1]|uniref:Flagellar hook-associated protein 2 n=1 Tax=Methyloglobulus morosus KoM1 TaxID=1116472 RepID=V5BJ87_9GAMM|nr:flagellar filament capping protein FliD [Methyloglobulus morosus]ESS73380.1 flagellar hook-associated protein 2 [Methyloglobulus morosus KoM1]